MKPGADLYILHFTEDDDTTDYVILLNEMPKDPERYVKPDFYLSHIVELDVVDGDTSVLPLDEELSLN